MQFDVGQSSIGMGEVSSADACSSLSSSAWPRRSGRKARTAAVSKGASTSATCAATRSPCFRAAANAGAKSANPARLGLPEKSTPSSRRSAPWTVARSLAASSTVRSACSGEPLRSTESRSRGRRTHSAVRDARARADPSCSAKTASTARTYPSASASSSGRGVVRSSRYRTPSAANALSTSAVIRLTAESFVTVWWIAPKAAKHSSNDRESSCCSRWSVVRADGGASATMVDSRADPCKWACNSAFGNDAQKRRREASAIRANPSLLAVTPGGRHSGLNLGRYTSTCAWSWSSSPVILLYVQPSLRTVAPRVTRPLFRPPALRHELVARVALVEPGGEVVVEA